MRLLLRRTYPGAGTCAALLLLGASNLVAQTSPPTEFAVLSHPEVNVRTGPDLDSPIVGRSGKSTLFPLVRETGGWYEIRLFTDAARYVHGSMAYRLSPQEIIPAHRFRISADPDSLRSIGVVIREERARAAREAEMLLPASLDRARNLALSKFLEDRYLLELFRRRALQPAAYWLPEAEALRR